MNGPVSMRAGRLAWLVYPAGCFAGGALATLAMAPLNAWAALFPALGFLYYATARAASGGQAFWRGWLFGVGYFIFGLHWIGNALLVEGNPFVWVYPLAIAALPVLLAVFFGTACLLVRRFSDMQSLPGYFAFAGFFLLCEWLRGHILTGFPWNLFGYAWADVPPLVQAVALGDIYFLTWLTVLWATAPGFMLLSTPPPRLKLALLAGLALSAGGFYAFGAWRLASYRPAFHENVRIRMVQPNIPQSEKWLAARMNEHFFKHVRLSYPRDDSRETTYIIWPETALNYGYLRDPAARGILTQALNAYAGKAYLMTGLLNRDAEGRIYNALVMIDGDGKVSNVYNKHHPVPLGEFIPLQKWIPIAPVSRFKGFTAGEGPRTFATPEGLTYSPNICYEMIFPGDIVDPEGPLPDFILNVTNDGWYGKSAGPHQHFTQAVFRAVEEGVPVLRAANTGFSGMVGPLGTIHYKSSYFTEDSQTFGLPFKSGAPGRHLPLRKYLPLLLGLCIGIYAWRAKSRHNLSK